MIDPRIAEVARTGVGNGAVHLMFFVLLNVAAGHVVGVGVHTANGRSGLADVGIPSWEKPWWALYGRWSENTRAQTVFNLPRAQSVCNFHMHKAYIIFRVPQTFANLKRELSG